MNEKNILRGFESLSIHGEGGYFPPARMFLSILCFIIRTRVVRSAFIKEKHLSQRLHIFIPRVPIRGDGTRRRGCANVVLSLLYTVTRSLIHHVCKIQSTINSF